MVKKITNRLKNFGTHQFKINDELHFSLRPYKYVFYRYLKECLKVCEPYDTVLDCASASGKHAYLFKLKKYTGVDIDQKIIDEAREKYKSYSNITFFCDDLCSLRSEVSNYTYDLVISSHTLANIDDKNINEALDNLIGLMDSKNGKLVIHFTEKQKDLIIHSLKNNKFNNLEIVCRYEYGGYLSFLYEKMLRYIYRVEDSYFIMPNKQSLVSYAMHYLLLNVSLIISFFDRFPPYSQFLYVLRIHNCHQEALHPQPRRRGG